MVVITYQIITPLVLLLFGSSALAFLPVWNTPKKAPRFIILQTHYHAMKAFSQVEEVFCDLLISKHPCQTPVLWNFLFIKSNFTRRNVGNFRCFPCYINRFVCHHLLVHFVFKGFCLPLVCLQVKTWSHFWNNKKEASQNPIKKLILSSKPVNSKISKYVGKNLHTKCSLYKKCSLTDVEGDVNSLEWTFERINFATTEQTLQRRKLEILRRRV